MPPRAALLGLASLVLAAHAQYYELVLVNTSAFPLALTLDGTPGGFWWLPGAASTKYVIHLQGGGWCTSLDDCFARSQTTLGSSRFWMDANCSAASSQAPCGYDGGTHGYFSVNVSESPLFAEANHVYIAYGDGASFAGSVSAPVPVPGQPAGTLVHFKGSFILQAVFATLLSSAYGMSGATEVLIGGTSAGGLATYLHCDRLAATLTAAAAAAGNAPPRITAMPDAGFFIDYPSFAGPYVYTPLYQAVAAMQNVTGAINDACVAAYSAVNASETWRCFMAQYNLPFVQTPLFVINSLADAWQASNIMQIGCNPSSDAKAACSPTQLAYLTGFSTEMLNRMLPRLSPASAAWLPECFVHPLAETDKYWGSVLVGGDTAGRLFERWYTAPASNASGVPLVRADAPVWGSNAC